MKYKSQIDNALESDTTTKIPDFKLIMRRQSAGKKSRRRKMWKGFFLAAGGQLSALRALLRLHLYDMLGVSLEN